MSLGDRARRFARVGFETLRSGLRELQRGDARQMAAALTYRTLFSLLPMVAVALVTLQAFVGEEQRQEFKGMVTEWVLGPLGREQALAQEETGPTVEGEQPSIADAPGHGLQSLDQARRVLEARVQAAVDALEGVDFSSIGVVGVLLFLFAATGLLGTIERTFNQVYRVPRGRPWQRRLPVHYTLVTVGPLALLAGLVLRSRFLALIEAGAWSSWLAGPLVVLSPLLTVWLVLLAMYLWIPNTRVSLRAAVAGALVGALATQALGELFAVYVRHAAAATLYGALALLPLFLLWLHLTWMAVLFGLEIAYQLQKAATGGPDGSLPLRAPHEVVGLETALAVTALVARSFDRGGVASAESVGLALGLSGRAVDRLFDRLVKARIVRQVPDRNREGYALARPADRIRLAEIVEALGAAGSKGGGGDETGDGAPLIETLRQSAKAAVGERTLADAMNAR